MARQYSHTQFFRHVPNALLKHYFQIKHNVLQDVDFAKLKESEVEPVFKALMALSFELQTEIEAETTGHRQYGLSERCDGLDGRSKLLPGSGVSRSHYQV